MRLAILAIISASAAVASVAIHDGCTEDSAIVAKASENDPMTVLHGVNGESLPCYAVSMTQSGKEIRGYVIDSKAPVIEEFVRVHALESRVQIPLPPAPAAPEPGQRKALTGPPFEPWSGVDMDGKRLKVDGSNAKVTLVLLWSSESAAGRRAATALMRTESQFRSKGLKAYGLVQAPSMESISYRLDDMGLDYPQAWDRQGAAAKYHANAGGTTLVIDSTNHIVLSSSDATQIRAAVQDVLGLNP